MRRYEDPGERSRHSESDVGGNWNFGAPTSRVYASTHLISSKPFTQFPDFPLPDSFPDRRRYARQ